MRIKNIAIENFRLLKNTSVDLEENLSLVLGKNNSGKTSLLAILEKFLGNMGKVSFEDFNLDFQKEIAEKISENLSVEEYSDLGIKLKLYIELETNDNLEKVADLILNLDPDDDIIVISIQYVLEYSKYLALKEDYSKYKQQIENKDVIYFLKKHHPSYFKMKKLALEFNNEENSIEVDDKVISKVINFQRISAKRGVANQEGNKSSDKTLSKLSSQYYDSRTKSDLVEISDLQKELINTDIQLNKNYESIFQPVVENIKKFGSSTQASLIEIRSNLEEKNILTENTIVAYNHNGDLLPEDYNGLGYMNLFAILFHIHIKIDQFRKVKEASDPSAINLLFIEEPEAHTHPQMQYVFIKNIKNMLTDESNGDGKKKYPINLQTIITTHSAHIASQSEFDDIKYFLRDNHTVIVKNLSELETQYGSDEKGKRRFQFLKQYLTLNHSELFFTDKVIFIEGNTERILIPAMMRKLDIEKNGLNGYSPLLSQHISIIEVGAYSQVFDKFLDFLNIIALIITDIDAVKSDIIIDENTGKVKLTKEGKPKKTKPKAVRTVEGEASSNSSINFYFSGKDFDEIKNLKHKDKILNNGKLYISYQIEENNYHARSFEDSFICINRDFVKSYKDEFNSLKNIDLLEDENIDAYDIADNCIYKKTMFATDILYFSNENLDNWVIPDYIKEGLLWLSSK